MNFNIVTIIETLLGSGKQDSGENFLCCAACKKTITAETGLSKI